MEAKAYLEDRQVQQAVAWALTIIGEAIKALPLDLRERHRAVTWTKWTGLRDFLVHQYFRSISAGSGGSFGVTFRYWRLP
jgi:uncharacterized protein with HEPN domain